MGLRCLEVGLRHHQSGLEELRAEFLLSPQRLVQFLLQRLFGGGKLFRELGLLVGDFLQLDLWLLPPRFEPGDLAQDGLQPGGKLTGQGSPLLENFWSVSRRGGPLDRGELLLEPGNLRLLLTDLRVKLLDLPLERSHFGVLGLVFVADALDRQANLLDLRSDVAQRSEHRVFGGFDFLGNDWRWLLGALLPRENRSRTERLDRAVEEHGRFLGLRGRVGSWPQGEGEAGPATLHQEVALLRESGDRHVVGWRRFEECVDRLLSLVEQLGPGFDVGGRPALADERRALEEVEPPSRVGGALRRCRSLFDHPQHHIGHVPLLQPIQQGEGRHLRSGLAAHQRGVQRGDNEERRQEGAGVHDGTGRGERRWAVVPDTTAFSNCRRTPSNLGRTLREPCANRTRTKPRPAFSPDVRFATKRTTRRARRGVGQPAEV